MMPAILIQLPGKIRIRCVIIPTVIIQVSRGSYTLMSLTGGMSGLRLENGRYTTINFFIRDSNLHEQFDGYYENHFQGNELYIQQCRNDWKGVQSYPGKLIEIQKVDKLDAVSGATWSFNIFKASVKDALAKAKIEPE